MKKEKNIYVVYVNVAKQRSETAYSVLSEVRKMMQELLPDDKSIIIPSNETKIECINPRFIDDKTEYENILRTVEKLNDTLNINTKNQKDE